MLSARGIYEDGKVILLEPFPAPLKTEVFVTSVEQVPMKAASSPSPTSSNLSSLDIRQHLIPAIQFLSEEKTDDSPCVPFQDVKDTLQFAKELREKAWNRSL